MSDLRIEMHGHSSRQGCVNCIIEALEKENAQLRKVREAAEEDMKNHVHGFDPYLRLKDALSASERGLGK
jgi:hypothetical protein